MSAHVLPEEQSKIIVHAAGDVFELTLDFSLMFEMDSLKQGDLCIILNDVLMIQGELYPNMPQFYCKNMNFGIAIDDLDLFLDKINMT